MHEPQSFLPDPSNLLQSCIEDGDKVDAKYARFKNILSCSNIDLGESSVLSGVNFFFWTITKSFTIAALRELSWSGIPADFRPMAWQILLVCVTLVVKLVLGHHMAFSFPFSSFHEY